MNWEVKWMSMSLSKKKLTKLYKLETKFVVLRTLGLVQAAALGRHDLVDTGLTTF